MTLDNHKVATGIIGFLAAWMFTQISALPEKYVLKSDYNAQIEIQNETLKEIRSDIKDLLQKGK